jgi:hypothetical protein
LFCLFDDGIGTKVCLWSGGAHSERAALTFDLQWRQVNMAMWSTCFGFDVWIATAKFSVSHTTHTIWNSKLQSGIWNFKLFSLLQISDYTTSVRYWKFSGGNWTKEPKHLDHIATFTWLHRRSKVRAKHAPKVHLLITSKPTPSYKQNKTNNILHTIEHRVPNPPFKHLPFCYRL